MKIATVSVSGVTAVAEIHSKIPAGIVGATVELIFPDPYWAGLIKNVQFAGAVDVPPILSVGNIVTIPASLVATPNELVQIGIIGVADDGETQITPTLWADLGVVRPSAGYIPEDDDQEGGGEIPEADPETWAQLLAMIGNMQNLTTEDRASLVAAINEVNEKAGGVPELKELVEALGDVLEPVVADVDKLTAENAQQAQEIAKHAQQIADILYEEITIKSITNNVGTVEIGRSIASVTVSWALNKEPVSQTVEGKAVEASDRSAVVSGPFTADRSFAVTATDERDHTAKGSTSIKFLNGIYYGALATGVVPDSAAVLAMTGTLQSGRGVTFTATPGSGKRPAYACPSRYGTPKFTIGGFEYSWLKIATIDFTNASVYTEKYDIWQHPQDVTGSMTITVS